MSPPWFPGRTGKEEGFRPPGTGRKPAHPKILEYLSTHFASTLAVLPNLIVPREACQARMCMRLGSMSATPVFLYQAAQDPFRRQGGQRTLDTHHALRQDDAGQPSRALVAMPGAHELPQCIFIKDHQRAELFSEQGQKTETRWWIVVEPASACSRQGDKLMVDDELKAHRPACKPAKTKALR